MKRRTLSIAVGLASGALALAVAIAATQIGSLQGTNPRSGGPRGPAPEFQGITRWFNSEPLEMADLRGDVVWIDVWTYSCINCIRSIPGVRKMYDRYGKDGLRVIGLHSPEFVFEKDPANVAAAIEREGIEYPVALDAEMLTWRAYRNQYWPRVYLIDAKGDIRFDHIGEGGEEDLQRQVRSLLLESGRKDLPEPVDFNIDGPGVDLTPETYAGYERGSNSLANPEGYDPSGVTDFDPFTPKRVRALGTTGRFALGGRWEAQEEFIEAIGPGARLDLPFHARNVFVVAASSHGPVSMKVLLDGRPIDVGSGSDLRGDTATIDRSDLYRVVGLKDPGDHVLTLLPQNGVRVYAFTFG